MMKLMKFVLIALAIGVAIVVINLIARMRKGREVSSESGSVSGSEDETTPPTKQLPEVVKINKNQAKKAFLTNLDKFAPILPSLNSESFDCRLWTEMIVTVNDFHLTELWKNYVYRADVKDRWKRLLASWQIKSDNCKSFTCLREDNILSYTLPNGDSLVMGEKYKVDMACWVYTEEDSEGNINKKIICRGIVVPYQE